MAQDSPAPPPPRPDSDVEEVLQALGRMGLPHGPATRLVPLTGGVASDIFRVDADGCGFVVKRALGKLRVAADWRVPVNRNQYEVAWLQVAGAILPQAVPAILGHDPATGMFAMEWLPPTDHAVWKSELLEGRADPEFAAQLGGMLAQIHLQTADRPDLAARFDSGRIFHAIRLEPYLEATARRHPAVADRLMALSAEIGATHAALVHGDVSPKNILCGPHGPVFLDAECALYGDPAFDLAFCLNHLLLKCLAKATATAAFLHSFTRLHEAYAATAGAASPATATAATATAANATAARATAASATAQRAARLLPALLLARVDGKSPVEYVNDEAQRDLVRRVAIPLIATPPASLDAVRAAWSHALTQMKS